MARYYLGVDGGGTNCRVRLADENLKTLAEAKKGRANLQIDNGDPGYDAIIEGTRDVLRRGRHRPRRDRATPMPASAWPAAGSELLAPAVRGPRLAVRRRPGL